jgi:hypothetical protein
MFPEVLGIVGAGEANRPAMHRGEKLAEIAFLARADRLRRGRRQQAQGSKAGREGQASMVERVHACLLKR